MKSSLPAFLFLLLVTACVTWVPQREHALRQAREFMNQGYPGQVRSLTCMNDDSDRDGYTSCTAFLNNNMTIALECADLTNDGCAQRNDGCRLQRAQMQGQVPTGN
jgi:hypothetical protein